MFKFVVAFVSAFLLVTPVIADECKSVDMVQTKALSTLPVEIRSSVSVRELPAALVPSFVAVYNTLPPASHLDANRIIMMAHKTVMPIFLMMIKGECVLQAGAVPPQMIQAIMTKVKRTSI